MKKNKIASKKDKILIELLKGDSSLKDYKDMDLIISELRNNGHIKDSKLSTKIGKVYAITDSGKEKLNNGGFYRSIKKKNGRLLSRQYLPF
jgi:hypothetical protein